MWVGIWATCSCSFGTFVSPVPGVPLLTYSGGLVGGSSAPDERVWPLSHWMSPSQLLSSGPSDMPGASLCCRWRGLVPAARDLSYGFPMRAAHMVTFSTTETSNTWDLTGHMSRAWMLTSVQPLTRSLLCHPTNGPKQYSLLLSMCPPDPKRPPFLMVEGTGHSEQPPLTLEWVSPQAQTTGHLKTSPARQGESSSSPPHMSYQGFQHTCYFLLLGPG